MEIAANKVPAPVAGENIRTLGTALAQAVTIVGIANAVVSLKMIPISVMPFGKQIVSTTSNR